MTSYQPGHLAKWDSGDKDRILGGKHTEDKRMQLAKGGGRQIHSKGIIRGRGGIGWAPYPCSRVMTEMRRGGGETGDLTEHSQYPVILLHEGIQHLIRHLRRIENLCGACLMFKRNLLNLVRIQLLQEPVQYITFYPDNKKVTLTAHHSLS